MKRLLTRTNKFNVSEIVRYVGLVSASDLILLSMHVSPLIAEAAMEPHPSTRQLHRQLLMVTIYLFVDIYSDSRKRQSATERSLL